MSFDWNQAKTFLMVVEEGSLSAAARKLGLTQPTVGRQIAALEAALQATLIEKTTRSVIVTEAGSALLDHVRIMARGADLVALAATGRSRAVEGLVRVTAAELTAAHALPPVIAALRAKAPLLQIDVVADDGVRDLIRREADVAIRHVRPEQPDLIARRAKDEVLRFYAASDYLKTRGRPRPDALEGHQIASFVGVDRMLGYLQPAGLSATAENFCLTTTSQVVALEMARAGLAMMIVPDPVAARFPELEPVLPEVGPFSVPTWLVAHRELQTSGRVRAAFDHLAEAFC